MRNAVAMIAGIAVIVAGCTRGASPTESEAGPPRLSEEEAIAIARDAVTQNDTWMDRATFEAKPDGTGWSVIVWRQPATPGGHRLVLIDAEGNVTDYIRGR